MQENLIQSFEDTIKSKYISNVLSSFKDIVASVETLKGLPIISSLISFYDLTKNIQLYRLAKKIHKFLYNIKDTTIEEREKFIKELSNKNKESACETLLNIIDRVDNINKMDVLSNLFKAKIRNDISMEDFLRLSVVFQRIPYIDMDNLKKYVKDYYEAGSTEVLCSAGAIYNSSINPSGDNSNKYRLNSTGAKLLKYGLGYNREIPQKNYTGISIPMISNEDIKKLFE